MATTSAQASPDSAPSILVPAQRVPVLAEADVLVCGAGPAGIAAAVSAARHGARVVLLERWASVGGQATHALVNVWHVSDRTRQVIFGLTQECIERAGRWVREWPGFPDHYETHLFEPEPMKVVFQTLLDDARVRTLCHLTVGDPILDGNQIRGVLVDTKAGRRAVLGRIVIDATGDGDVAAKAGVPFDVGRPEDGRVQGCTMLFRCCGVDDAALQTITDAHERAIVEQMQRLRERGALPAFRDAALEFRNWFYNRNIQNLCPVAGNPLDEEELTRMTATARRTPFALVEHWRRVLPGYAQAEVEATGAMLGVRETRRIRGLKTLDRATVVGAVKQPDALGHGFWPIDIHDPKGGGHTTYTDKNPRDFLPPGETYHLPLGVCLNAQIPNLAVAGRCASATHEGQASLRLQSHCMVVGQGLGTAAALALDSNQSLHTLDMPRLQHTLRASNVYLRDVPPA